MATCSGGFSFWKISGSSLIYLYVKTLELIIYELRCSKCMSELIIPNNVDNYEDLEFTCTICEILIIIKIL